MADPRDRSAAEVDRMVDERGAPIDVPDGSRLEIAAEDQPTVGATGPTNWWRLGLVALGIVIFILLLLQIFGGEPGTEVVSGTPTAAPEAPAPLE